MVTVRIMCNTSDDWDYCWTNCPKCNRSYHMSDGGCDCSIMEQERKIEKFWDEFNGIEEVVIESALFKKEDAWGDFLNKGDMEVVIYTKDNDFTLTLSNWKRVQKILNQTSHN